MSLIVAKILVGFVVGDPYWHERSGGRRSAASGSDLWLEGTAYRRGRFRRVI